MPYGATAMSVVVAVTFGYPSAHASASHAARAIADRLLGEDGHSITLSNGGTTLTYTSFEQIADDIDDERRWRNSFLAGDESESTSTPLRAGVRRAQALGAAVTSRATPAIPSARLHPGRLLRLRIRVADLRAPGFCACRRSPITATQQEQRAIARGRG
jgi:hypothetical protein